MIHNQGRVLGMLTYLLLSEWIWKEWTSMSELAVTGNSFNSMYITSLTIYVTGQVEPSWYYISSVSYP